MPLHAAVRAHTMFLAFQIAAWVVVFYLNDLGSPSFGLRICIVVISWLVLLTSALMMMRLHLQSQPIRIDQLARSTSSSVGRVAGWFMPVLVAVGSAGLTAVAAYYSQTNDVGPVLYAFATLVASISLAWVLEAVMRKDAYRLVVEGNDFVLFLRRFGSTADVSLSEEIFKLSSIGIRSVVIASGTADPRKWDPFLVSLAGLSLRPRSIWYMPIFLSTTDDRWFRDVQWLMDRSRCVVIDVSEVTASIGRELFALRSRSDRDQKTVYARIRGTKSTSLAVDGETIFEYSLAWAGAWLRIAVGSCVTAAIAWLCGMMVYGVAPFVALSAPDQPFGSTVATVAAVATAGFVGWRIGKGFLRPAIARADRRRFRSLLAAFSQR
jgi:hypothetical protein